MKFDGLIRSICGYDMKYDTNGTLYLKCPYCDEVLINVDVEDRHLSEEKSWKNFENVLDNAPEKWYNDLLSDGNISSAPSDIVIV